MRHMSNYFFRINSDQDTFVLISNVNLPRGTFVFKETPLVDPILPCLGVCFLIVLLLVT